MNKKIIHNNNTVFYRVMGQGKPVVLLHGFGEDGELWDQQTGALTNNYQLIIPDLPGSGQSGAVQETSMEAMADTLKAILVNESINDAVLIGHSMGGYVSMAFAEKFPGMLQALGLFHSTAYEDSEEKKIARKKNIDFIDNHGSYNFLKQSTPGLFSETFNKRHPDIVNGLIEKYRDLDPHVLSGYQQAMINRSDRRQLLKQIAKPVLFVIGGHDKAIPLQDSMEQCHLPALSYIHILKDSGHKGMLEEVEKSKELLQGFLADITWPVY